MWFPWQPTPPWQVSSWPTGLSAGSMDGSRWRPLDFCRSFVARPNSESPTTVDSHLLGSVETGFIDGIERHTRAADDKTSMSSKEAKCWC